MHCVKTHTLYLKTKVPAVPWPRTSDGAKEILPTCTSSLFPSETDRREEWSSKWLISSQRWGTDRNNMSEHAKFSVLPAVGLSPEVPFMLPSEMLPLWLWGLSGGSADAGGESGYRNEKIYSAYVFLVWVIFSVGHLIKQWITNLRFWA